MEHPVKEHDYEEGEISDNDLPWKGNNRVVQLGSITQDRSMPLLPRPFSLVQKGDNNSWSGKGFGLEQLETKGRQHDCRWRAETSPFPQQPEHFFQMAWEKGVQGLTEDSLKEPSGISVDGLMRDIKAHKGTVNRLSSFSESISKAEKSPLKNGSSLRRVASWTTNRDFDICLGRKGGRLPEGQEAEFSNILDKRKSENGNLSNEGKERTEHRRFCEPAWRNRLEWEHPIKPGNAERVTLRSTIEKVDREDSESEDIEGNKANEKEEKPNLQLDLPEGQPQHVAAAQIRPIIGEKEEGELEEGEIQGGSPASLQYPSKDNADRLLHSEREKERTKERSSETRGYEKSYLRNDLREKKHHETSNHQRIADYDHRLLKCTELVKNVSVRDAQRSFISVCRQLYSALKILRDTTKHMDRPSPKITNLARQAFSGIQAAYAVRNTASGKEQEKNKDIFPRLLELAYGSHRKLFTSLQVKELETMLQTSGQQASVLQTSGQQASVFRSEQSQKNHNKESGQFESDKTEKEPQLGDSSVNTSATTQLEMESTAETIIDSKVFDLDDIGPASDTCPLPAEPQLSCDSHAVPMGIVESSQMTMSACSSGVGGWFPMSSEHIQEHVAVMDTSRDFTYPSLSVDLLEGNQSRPTNSSSSIPSSLTTSKSNNTQIFKSTEFGMKQKWETEDNRISHSSSEAPDMQEESTSLLDPLSAVTCYHEKFAGKSLMAYTRLPSPTPEEEGESEAGSEVEPSHSLGNQENVDQSCHIIEEPQLTPQVAYETSGSDLISNIILDETPCNIAADPCDVAFSEVTHTKNKSIESIKTEVLEGHMTSKDHLLVKGPLKSRDPRRKLANAPLNPDAHQNEHSSYPTEIRLSQNTHTLEESSKKRKTDDSIEDVKGPKYLCVSNDGPLSALHKDQPPAFSIRPKDRGIEETVVAPDPVEGLKDIEVDNLALFMELPSSSNTATKRERVSEDVMDMERNSDVLSEDLNSIPIPSTKRQKVETVKQELNDTSLINCLTIGEEPAAMLCQETNKLSQPLVTTSARPKAPSEKMGRDTTKLRMKARDPRRALLGTMLEKDERLSSNASKEAGIALAGTPLIKDGGISMMQVSTSEHEVRPSIMKDRGGSDQAPEEGYEPSEKMKEKTNSIVTLRNSQSSTVAQKLASQMRVSAVSKELSGKIDPSLSTIKQGTDDLACNTATDIGRATSIPLLNKKEMNENTGLRPAKQESSSNHWEGVEHLLEGLDEKQRHAFRQERARRIEEQTRMLRDKKLCLVLDLDHTLLNSAKFSEIEVEWENRLRANEAAERARIMKEGAGKRELYRFPHMGMWTKLRPGIWNFLARASQLFELHVYTMGNKVYATEMAKLLDPTGTLFAERVISKGDEGDLVDGDERLPKSKDLDGVLGMESAVVIIDDSLRVWPHHRHNLIVVERYMYFPCSRRQFGLPGPSLLEVGHDEREVDGMLSSALAVIERIHFSFFSNQRLHEVDVRDILATEQRKVLAGCKILFSRVFPQGESQPQLHPLWKIAEQFGAVCTTTMDEGITHVVAISLGTDKVNWAVATGRFVVRPAWLEASAILYRRVNEWDYPVPS